MFIARGGKLYTAPFESEYLGDDAAGVPQVYLKSGVMAPMTQVHPRLTGGQP